ncbi:DUF456 domain-containing protein [Ahniella affigens]|uniref:DUF456 domain-containing protein n=1 Tax=Ahniella affigens TaxID=2021234 RepID=A0A2P1PLR7_9GAMM|nr:DUF456 domain-containing protein [Ahniella affigens]AVP95776.1 DUF456 domain-containing protein [Ahniella affigens]
MEAILLWLSTYGWYVLAGLCVLVGIVGTILPALPGIALVYVGLLIAAWHNGFERVSIWTMLVLGVLVAFAMLVDFLASAFGTKLAGASRWAFVGAGLGVLVGIFFGLPGLLIGPFVGAVLAEVAITQNVKQSLKAGIGATLGLLAGGLAKIALTFTMLGLFALAWLI